MNSLRKIIFINLRRITLFMVAAILMLAVFSQIMTAQNQARSNASATFLQISQILKQNEKELESVKSDYRATCLYNAETIAYIIQKNPDILGDVEQFRELAYMLELDEIHVFDTTGRIFTGTHPEYYDYNFDSGEQMNFFKPMLEDKSLRLCQDITPNTAEGKLVQYSALWSSDEQFIVQVGMYPDAVLEVTEKNELSYIFSLLQGSPGVSLYAINPGSGVIVGSSSGNDNGKLFSRLGFSMNHMDRYMDGAHVKVRGVNSFCIFEQADDILIGYVVSNDQLYANVPGYSLVLLAFLLLIAMALVLLVQSFLNQYIVNSIYKINTKLRAIGSGDLNERISVQSSQEFSELSEHLNQMVSSLLASTDKISFVLDRIDMQIGVYEYSAAMKNVRYTKHIPDIFGLSREEMDKLAADHRLLKEFIARLTCEPVPERDNTYRYLGRTETFITLEEVANGSDVLGIVMNVTDEVNNLRQAEAERDIDLLTGLYNRRGIMRRLETLFSSGADLGHGAIIILDSDDLKVVNDTHGHTVGDDYLRHLSGTLRDFSAPAALSGRIGGDEFLMMIYGYKSEDELMDALTRLHYIQKNSVMNLEGGSTLPVCFSFGYVQTRGRMDYHTMIKEADSYMYDVKRLRKKTASNADIQIVR